MELEVSHITKNFGEKTVLRDVSLSVQSGQALGLLGRNGAGKTTLIRIIMGVFNADGGQVLVDGKPIDRKAVRIGYLPEERGLYPKKTIRDQLLYFAALKGMEPAEARKSLEALLKRLELSEYASKKLEVLSKGNQQKIQLAVALIDDPDVLVLDEPFSGLDPVNAMLLKEIVSERIRQGKIVMFSSHQMSYVEEFCRHIAILNSGRIVLSGSVREIKRSYDRQRLVMSSARAAEVKRFIEENARDLATSVAMEEEKLTVRLAEAGMKMELLRRISERRLDIDAFSVYEPSLSDIFVEYTEAGS